MLIPYQTLLSTLCSELEIKKTDVILEAGCGTGNLALMIKNNGSKVIGLDNCNVALELYRTKDPVANTILGNLTDILPFPNNYFDKIVSNNTLYIIDKGKQILALKELYRILKPGGKIVISNPIITGSPIKIYLSHIKLSIKATGVLKTIKVLLRMLLPTTKIFWFNMKIKKMYHYSLFELNGQKNLLMQSGFIKISPTKLVYADQNILNSAFKPI